LVIGHWQLIAGVMSFSRFDAVVWSVLVTLAGLTAVVIVAASQIALEMEQFTPGWDSTNVSTQSQIRVAFVEEIASVPDTAVTLSPFISGTTTFTGNTLTFQPSQPLAPNTDYQVTLAEGIEGADGRTLHEPIAWQFHTGQPRILFIKPDSEAPDQLFVADPTGQTPPVQLTQALATVIDFAVAPDSSQIAYSVMTHDDGMTANSDIWLMNADGTDQHIFLACPDAVCTRPLWMPDGRRLIYERRNIPQPGAPPGNPRLWWLDAQTGETVPVFADSQLLGLAATISPDGQWLSFVSPTDQGIQLYHLADGTGRLIPNRMGTAVSWRPDSQQIALADIVTSGQDWNVFLYTFDVDADQPVLLSQPVQAGFEVDDSSPVWSADGQTVVFGRKEARTSMGRQMWLMNADGTNAIPLTGETDIHHSNMALSPDGRTLLYQRYNLKELYTQPGVWVMDIQTGQVTEIAYPATQPAWLP
jgi:Tol biopolymer transport system component